MDNSILIIKYDTIYDNTPLVKHFVSLWDTFWQNQSLEKHKNRQMTRHHFYRTIPGNNGQLMKTVQNFDWHTHFYTDF
jgi:hypothetical protein